MLPHRSDTSRGHLHPRRVATPRPFPSRRPFFPDLPFLSISRPISSIQRGCFSPVRPLMPPLSWGALARKPPFFPSQASLLPGTNPPPAIFNPPSPSSLSFFLFFPPSSPSPRSSYGGRCNHGHCARASNLDSLEIIPEYDLGRVVFCTRENLLISFLPSC